MVWSAALVLFPRGQGDRCPGYLASLCACVFQSQPRAGCALLFAKSSMPNLRSMKPRLSLSVLRLLWLPLSLSLSPLLPSIGVRVYTSYHAIRLPACQCYARGQDSPRRTRQCKNYTCRCPWYRKALARLPSGRLADSIRRKKSSKLFHFLVNKGAFFHGVLAIERRKEELKLTFFFWQAVLAGTGDTLELVFL